MDVNDIKSIILRNYEAGLKYTVVMLGPPGIGKTESMEQLARELALKLGKTFIRYDDSKLQEILANPDKYFVFISFPLMTTEPVDLTGIPKEMNGFVQYKPLAWVAVLTRCAGLLFLDEITNLQRPDVQSATLKILQEHEVGYLLLHQDVQVVAAGNKPKGYKGGSNLAGQLPDPLFYGKALIFEVDPPTLERWIAYMDESKVEWDRRVAAFLRKFPDKFFTERQGDPFIPSACPRSWTRVARLMLHYRDDELQSILSSLLDPDTTTLFVTFVQTQVPELKELVENPSKWDTLKLDAKYLISSQLSKFAPKELVDKYAPILRHLAVHDREFLQVTISLYPRERRRELVAEIRRLPDVFQTLVEITKTVFGMV